MGMAVLKVGNGKVYHVRIGMRNIVMIKLAVFRCGHEWLDNKIIPVCSSQPTCVLRSV